MSFEGMGLSYVTLRVCLYYAININLIINYNL